MNFESKSKFISVYVPHSSFGYMTYEICKKIPELCEVYLRDAADRVFVGSRDPADSSMEGSDQLIFTGKIFVYHEDELSLEELGSLESLYKSKKLFPQFRGLNYVTTRWLQRKSTS